MTRRRSFRSVEAKPEVRACQILLVVRQACEVGPQGRSPSRGSTGNDSILKDQKEGHRRPFLGVQVLTHTHGAPFRRCFCRGGRRSQKKLIVVYQAYKPREDGEPHKATRPAGEPHSTLFPSAPASHQNTSCLSPEGIRWASSSCE